MTAVASGNADRRERGLAVCDGTMKVSLSEASWKKIRLGDVCRVVPGHAFRSEHWQKTGVPVIKIKNICGDNTVDVTDTDCVPEELVTERLSKFVLRDSDILIAMTGATAGKVGKLRTDRPMLLNQRVARIEPVEADRDFVWFVLSSKEYESRFFRLADGAAQPNMSGSQIEGVELFLPPLPIQRKIASILSAYDDLIENNTLRIKILEEMAQTIYREWFIHFRFPGYEKLKMVDSPLGKIPEGWVVKKLGDVIELAYGRALKAENRVDGLVVVYGSGGVVGYHNEGLVKGPGVIVGRKGNVGRVYWSDDDFFPIDTVFYVQTEISLAYAFYNLRSQNFINNDAAVPGLNRNQAYLLPFLLPNSGVLTQFQDVVSCLFAQINNLRNESANLRRTRDLLLPGLISGELDVESIGRRVD